MMNSSDSSNLFTLKPELSWRIDQSFNPYVDFCIWVLEIDGLRVPPFDQHPEGNRILQNQGLNADSWQKWLTTVVALQDWILRWHELCPNESLFIEEQLNNFNAVYLKAKQDPEWSNQQIDLPAIRSSLLNYCSVYERQYQAAITQVSHIPGNPLDYIERPFDVFPDSPEIKEILVSLWQRYQQICEQERAETSYQKATSKTTGGTTKIWGYEYLNIYKVRYTIPLQHFVPSVSVIISLGNKLVSHSDNLYVSEGYAPMTFVQINL